MAITPPEARSAKRQTESESENTQASWQIRTEMDGLRPHAFGIKLALTPG